MADSKSEKPESRGQEQDSKLKLVSSFLELQQKELAVKQDEIAYHQFSKEKDVALAEKALASDERLEMKQIEASASLEKQNRWLLLIVILAFLGLITYLVSVNKDALVEKLFALLGAMFGGGGVGYWLGFNKGKKSGGGAE